MKKPIIGITPQLDSERERIWIGPNYMNAIRAAGGIPILLPLRVKKEDLALVAEMCDGFLFTGGADISPFRFGEETIQQCGIVQPERDLMEEDLFSIAMEGDKPILGICRGIQIFNVFLGGTVYQDINTQFDTSVQLAHYQKSGNTVLSHNVIVEKDTLLSSIVEKEYMPVNSFHHQAIKDLAPGLEIAAVSPDSLIEAVYHPDKTFFLGVQWHPEHLYRKNDDALKIFEAFVDACSEN